VVGDNNPELVKLPRRLPSRPQPGTQKKTRTKQQEMAQPKRRFGGSIEFHRWRGGLNSAGM
jgi:hypothetical protein